MSTKITVLADYNNLSTDEMRQFIRTMNREFPDVEFKRYLRRGDEVTEILNAVVEISQNPLIWVFAAKRVVDTIDRTLDVIRKGVEVYREIRGDIRDVSSMLTIKNQGDGPSIQCNAPDLLEREFNLEGLVQTLQDHSSDEIKRASLIMVARDDEGNWRLRHYSGKDGLSRDFD